MVKNLHIKLLILSFYVAAVFIFFFISPHQNRDTYILAVICISAANFYFMNSLDFILYFRKFSIFYCKKTVIIFVLLTAVFLIVSKILSRESSTGKTKHAANCPSSLPAFIKVGEFGIK